MLELGAGTGHLAVALARLGAQVTVTEGPGNSMAALRSWSAQLLREVPGGGLPLDADSSLLGTGNALGGSLEIRELWWGGEFTLDADGAFDVVIMSELTYDVDCHEPLLQTLQRALKPGKLAWQIFVDRPFSMGFLMLLDDAGERNEFARVSVNEGGVMMVVQHLTRVRPSTRTARRAPQALTSRRSSPRIHWAWTRNANCTCTASVRRPAAQNESGRSYLVVGEQRFTDYTSLMKPYGNVAVNSQNAVAKSVWCTQVP